MGLAPLPPSLSDPLPTVSTVLYLFTFAHLREYVKQIELYFARRTVELS